MAFRLVAGLGLASIVFANASVSDAQDVQIWLDSGEIELQVPGGETVALEAGEFLGCTAGICEVLPLAAAPVRPEFAQILGQAAASSAPAAGGVAPGALGLSAGAITTVGIAGAAVVAAGVVVGVVAASEATPSTGTQ